MCLVAGAVVGYMYHYGLLDRIKISNAKATLWESGRLFGTASETESFVKTGALGPTMAGEIINPGQGAAPVEESKSAGFKAFAGKGISIGASGPAQPAVVADPVGAPAGRSNNAGRSKLVQKAIEKQQEMYVEKGEP